MIAQTYNFRRYSVTEGLPHSLVSTIIQDHKGYMWFGTLGGGLSRFDGYTFKTFTRENGLRDNVVNSVFEDSKNNFWVSTDEGGVGILRDSLKYQFQDSPLDTVAVYNIKESPDGRIWFATYGAGVFVYDGTSLKQLTIEDGLSSNFIWDFSFSEDGSVWIGTHYGLSILHLNSGTEGAQIDTITDENVIGGYAVYDILKDSEKELWFATNNGVTKYSEGDFDIISEINNNPLGFTYALIEDAWGNIWIGTAENGIYRQFGDQNFHHVTEQNGLSSNFIYTLYKDHRDKIWVGTNEDGADLYKGDAFIRIMRPANREAWSLLSVTSTDDGNLWMGTDGDGLWKIEKGDRKFSPEQIGLEGREVWSVEELQNGNLLLLMGNNRILEYDGTNFEDYSKKIGMEPVPYTIDLFIDSRNRVWIGTDEGAYRITNGRKKLFSQNEGLSDNFIWEITERNDQIWIATDDGLSILENDSLRNYTTKDGLVHNVVSTVISGKDQKAWLGTSGGISKMKWSSQKERASFTNFNASDGLQLVETQLLQIDKNGYLWQGTNAGLQVFNSKVEKGTVNLAIGQFMTEENRELEFAHKAVTTDSKNIIWFGSTSGLLRYNPEKFEFPASGPDVRITSLQINFQNQIDLEHLDEAQNIAYDINGERAVFEYDQENLGFTFSAFEFEDPRQVTYRYRLKGFNDQWSEESNAKLAQFTNLKARDYTFEVQAKNKYGIWGKTASFPFTVNPPFWNTYWFYVLAFSLILFIGYIALNSWFNHIQANQLKVLVNNKTEKLQKALKEKEVLIKEIHHRVKNNLAVISGLFELQLDHIENDHADKVLRESQRRVLSISMIHEKLYQNESLSEIDFQKYISELVEIISYSFSHIDKDIVTNIDVDDNIMLSLDQGIPCGLIINELVSNVYEHAFIDQKSGKIEVIFSNEGKEVTLTVRDNGIGMNGFDLTHARESLGITLVETLTQQLEGDLNFESTPSGTVFTIQFKMDNSTPEGVPLSN